MCSSFCASHPSLTLCSSAPVLHLICMFSVIIFENSKLILQVQSFAQQPSADGGASESLGQTTSHSKELCSASFKSSSQSSKTPSFEIDAHTEGSQETALTLASSKGYSDFVHLLVSKGANIEHKDRKGFTPLLHAACTGHFKIVKVLVRAGANIEAEVDKSKDTALSLACANCHAKIVGFLIRKGANTEHRNIEDYTPLSHAAAKGHVKIIQILLLYGAEINSRTNSKFGMSPLMLASMYGHANAVSLLLDQGGDVNAQNEIHKTTALSLACFNGKHEIVSLLADRKANLEHRAKAGLTPLMEAAQGGFVEVGKILLERGADVAATPISSSRDTALGIAAEKGHFAFVQLLLSKNAPVDVKNKRGATPLWLACNSGHPDVVKILLQHGSDPDSMDNRKISCLVAALKNGHIWIVKLLVDHVSQLPPDQECVKYRKAFCESEMSDSVDKCLQCLEIIKKAKEKQAMKAYENAVILLDELQQEKKMEAKKRAAKEKKREKKKQRKKDKTALTSNTKPVKQELSDNGISKSSEKKESRSSGEGRSHKNSFNASDDDIFEKENKPKCIVKTINSTFENSKQKSKLDNNNNHNNSNNNTNNISSKIVQDIDEVTKVPSNMANKKIAKTTTSHSNNNLPLQNSTIQHQNCMDLRHLVKSKISSISDLDDFGYLVMPPPTNIVVAPVIMSSASLCKVTKSETPSKSSTDSTPQRYFMAPSDPSTMPTSTTPLISSATSSSSSLTMANGGHDVGNCLLSTPYYSRDSAIHRPSTTTALSTSCNLKPFARKKLSLASTATLVTTNSTSTPYKKEDFASNKEQLKKIKKLDVPAKAVSRVIGRGGCNINAIREFSGAKIDLDKLKTSDDAVVTIKGLADSIIKASELISALIREADKDIDQLISSFKQQLATGSISLLSSNDSPTTWKRTSSVDAFSQRPLVVPSSNSHLKDSAIPAKNVWENRKLQNALAEKNKIFNANEHSANKKNVCTKVTAVSDTNVWHAMPKTSTAISSSTPSSSDDHFKQQVLISNISSSNVWDNAMADGIEKQAFTSSASSENDKPQLITTFPIGAWKSVENKGNRPSPPGNRVFQKPFEQCEKDINKWVSSVNSSNNASTSPHIATSIYTKFPMPANDSSSIATSAEALSESTPLPRKSSSHPNDPSKTDSATSHTPKLFNLPEATQQQAVEDSSSRQIREYSPFGGVLFNNQAPLVTKAMTAATDMVVDKSKAPGYRPASMLVRTSPPPGDSAMPKETQSPQYNLSAAEEFTPSKRPLNVEVNPPSEHQALFHFDPQVSLCSSDKQEVLENDCHNISKSAVDKNASPLLPNAQLLFSQQPPPAFQSSTYSFNLGMFLSSQHKLAKSELTREAKVMSQSRLLQSSNHLQYPPTQQSYISHVQQPPLINSDFNPIYHSLQSQQPSTATNCHQQPPKHYSPLSVLSSSPPMLEINKQPQLQPIGTERNNKKQQKFSHLSHHPASSSSSSSSSSCSIPPSAIKHESVPNQLNNNNNNNNMQRNHLINTILPNSNKFIANNNNNHSDTTAKSSSPYTPLPNPQHYPLAEHWNFSLSESPAIIILFS